MSERRQAPAPHTFRRTERVVGAQTIRVTVPREPARAGIDPWHKLVDRQTHDNMVEVEIAVAGLSPARAGR